MPSATDFLPAYITEFMNFVMMMFPNLGSGFTSRFSAEWRRDILFPSSWPGSSRPSTSQLVVPDPRVSLRSPGMTLVIFGSLRTLGAVLRTALLTVLDALGIQHAAEN